MGPKWGTYSKNPSPPKASHMYATTKKLTLSKRSSKSCSLSLRCMADDVIEYSVNRDRVSSAAKSASPSETTLQCGRESDV